MKNVFLAVIALFAFFATNAIADTYQADASKSKVKWEARKVLGKHDGTVALKSGSLDIDGSKITGGNFTVDMSTIKVVDITDEAMNKKLTGHLNSDDFFNVDNFKTADLKIKSAKIISSESNTTKYRITGDMTIKGKTNEVSFVAELSGKGNAMTAKGKIELDRTLWDIKYGSANFFDSLGDKAIYDVFELELDVTLSK